MKRVYHVCGVLDVKDSYKSVNKDFISELYAEKENAEKRVTEIIKKGGTAQLRDVDLLDNQAKV